MFGHAVVALDLTPAGDAVLTCLPGLRGLGVHELTLVHVAEVGYPVAGAVAHLDHHRARLQEMAGRLRNEGFQVDIQSRMGGAATEILRVADERGAALVLVGTRSRSRIYQAVVGSVAMKVMERSTAPILLVPLDAPCRDLGRHVLFASDFSRGSEDAFLAVETLARSGGRSFTLLHALGREGDPDSPSGKDARKRLEDLSHRLGAVGAEDVHLSLPTQDPADAVVQAAIARPGTLVVMGTQGRGFAERLALGSVSRAVAGRVRAPLLLVPTTAGS
jgi:nucleotide-binding universal stress UspA family protein